MRSVRSDWKFVGGTVVFSFYICLYIHFFLSFLYHYEIFFFFCVMLHFFTMDNLIVSRNIEMKVMMILMIIVFCLRHENTMWFGWMCSFVCLPVYLFTVRWRKKLGVNFYQTSAESGSRDWEGVIRFWQRSKSVFRIYLFFIYVYFKEEGEKSIPVDLIKSNYDVYKTST